MTYNNLPPVAAAFHNVTGAPILISRGVMGFSIMTSGDHPDDKKNLAERSDYRMF